MRCFVQTLILMTVLSLEINAQPSNVYVFFAPGGLTGYGRTDMTLHAGLGGEAIVGKGVGVGAELGAVGPRQYLADAVGLFSPNGYYHFVHGKNVKVDPFVTGGYTLLFRAGHVNLFNFGAGVNYWFHRRIGTRFEFRDHVYHNYATLHYWGFRFGLALGGNTD
jgi:hypothetical protein